MQKVAVLMGGISSERAISLDSGNAVVAGLREAGYEVIPVILETAELTDMPAGISGVFIALHGGYGEDGGVQAALDARGIPYTGPGAEASRKTIDKVITKEILTAHGVPVPEYEVLRGACEVTSLALPVVVKPPRDGSSMGLTKVSAPEELAAAVRKARVFDHCAEVLVERYIPGREWTVGIVAGEALPVLEIVTPQQWYGFEEKYSAGISSYVFPEAQCDAPLVAQCQLLALVAYEALGCRGVSRVDFRVTNAGEPYILELNTVPGFTATSLLPKAAAKAGLSFSQLCGRLMRSAACD